MENTQKNKLHNNDNKCAPSKIFENYSCIPLNLLIAMAKAYNDESKNKNKIVLYANLDTLNPNKYKAHLVKSFQDRLSSVCSDQKCWTKQKFINNLKREYREELQHGTFRPTGPKGKFEWLNTLNINEVMVQYEKKYKDFKFMGAVPIDFEELSGLGFQNINFGDFLKEGIKKLGIIFNLDEHYKPGSHWVGLYIDLNGKIYFFDSYGIRPDPRIRKFMRKVARFCKYDLNNKNIEINYNKNRHQYEGSECGVYSINFILRMLKGESFDNICKNKIPDKVINQCRKVYFT